MLKHAERIAVILAAIAAMFPLYQFWSEAEMRLLERRANYIQALHLCPKDTGFKRRPITAIGQETALSHACTEMYDLRTKLAGEVNPLTGVESAYDPTRRSDRPES